MSQVACGIVMAAECQSHDAGPFDRMTNDACDATTMPKPLDRGPYTQ